MTPLEAFTFGGSTSFASALRDTESASDAQVVRVRSAWISANCSSAARRSDNLGRDDIGRRQVLVRGAPLRHAEVIDGSPGQLLARSRVFRSIDEGVPDAPGADAWDIRLSPWAGTSWAEDRANGQARSIAFFSRCR